MPIRRITFPAPPSVKGSPRSRVLALIDTMGEPAVAVWCAGLLARTIPYDDPGKPPITWLGDGHAERLLRRRGFEERGQDYWPRVWGARALLYAWSEVARSGVIGGLADSSWRVREMSAKVVRAREIADAEAALATLVDDPVPRVRVAAARALGRVGEVEHGELVAQMTRDRDALVRSAARRALAEMEKRLDRDFRV